MLPLNLIEPVVTFRNSQGTAVRGTLIGLQRRALVMEIYNPYSIVQVSEVLGDVTVRAGPTIVYKGRATVSSLLNTGLMAVASVTLLDEWSDLNATAGSAAAIGPEARRFVEEWESRFRIRASYQVAVSELRAFLTDTARWLDQADLSTSLPRADDGRLRDDVFNQIAEPILAKLSSYADRLEGEAEQVPEEESLAHRQFAQGALHPLLLRAPFAYRAFSKPLGYAGDYEMVNQILGDPRQGASTYFQVVNSMYLRMAVARAHRNRIDILVDRLRRTAAQAEAEGRPFRVLNVGCGPAVEVLRFVEQASAPGVLDFTLLDFNEETLAFVRQRLAQMPAVVRAALSLRLVHRSVHELLKSAARPQPADATYDFIYCAGLFDYLSDKVCSRLVRYFLAHAAPDSRVLVTNVHRNNPDRRTMEHILEWHLIYRDEPQLSAVFPPESGTPTTFTDATGVNLFAELTCDGG
ncbi:MAG: class I SAM-dependent methyltransferase [Betaproteobacteria bacterium]